MWSVAARVPSVICLPNFSKVFLDYLTLGIFCANLKGTIEVVTTDHGIDSKVVTEDYQEYGNVPSFSSPQ